MHSKAIFVGALAHQAAAFPWVARQEGVNSQLLRGNVARAAAGSASTCPYNSNHTGAAPITSQFPYCSAKNGLPGVFPCNNNLVPATGDTAHQFEAPGPNDIRGPCPGINTAANHHFLSHDGITTFDELIDMQQNVYGVGWDLAVLLAVLGVGLDGDVVSGKLSIGCDATSRTSTLGLGLVDELGLDGHNKFEGDTSLTRNDYFLADGDNYSFNSTLYDMMTDTAAGSFDRAALSKYRYQRYQQSRAENENFYFGPKSVLLYGAASFLYELFPSGGNEGTPDQATMDSFFRTERIPDNWYSRSEPYSIPLVAAEIFDQYTSYPVEFGGNLGPNNFVGAGLSGVSFSGNLLNTSDDNAALCLLYQIATENVPSALGGGGTSILSDLSDTVLSFMRGKISKIQVNSPCPINYNDS